MSEAVEVKVERLRRLDLAIQTAECGLADAFSILARIIEGRSLSELEVVPDGLNFLCELQKMIAYLCAMRTAARARADDLAREEEARRA